MDKTGLFLCIDEQPHKFIFCGIWFAYQQGEQLPAKQNYAEFICADTRCGISMLRPMHEIVRRREIDILT
jgi:hypothetical protein